MNNFPLSLKCNTVTKFMTRKYKRMIGKKRNREKKVSSFVFCGRNNALLIGSSAGGEWGPYFVILPPVLVSWGL